jgi:ribosomal protein S8
MKNQNDENEEIEFILKVLDFNEMIDDWEKILKASEEERRNVELNRENRNFNLRKRKSINRRSTQAFIEKFSIWEKQANN